MPARSLTLIEFVIKTGQSSLLNVWQVCYWNMKLDCFDPSCTGANEWKH